MSDYHDAACPFCGVAADRIIERNAHAFAIADAFPVNRGHTLIISRRHVADFLELAKVEADAVCRLARLMRKRLDQEFHPQGYNIGVNIGAAAGQTVMYAHMHLIPRFSSDVEDPVGGVRNVIPGKGRYD
ncbi:MAG: HIT family protein [Thermoguttaceae bacterium]